MPDFSILFHLPLVLSPNPVFCILLASQLRQLKLHLPLCVLALFREITFCISALLRSLRLNQIKPFPFSKAFFLLTIDLSTRFGDNCVMKRITLASGPTMTLLDFFSMARMMILAALSAEVITTFLNCATVASFFPL